jgi:hypothetical protein
MNENRRVTQRFPSIDLLMMQRWFNELTLPRNQLLFSLHRRKRRPSKAFSVKLINHFSSFALQLDLRCTLSLVISEISYYPQGSFRESKLFEWSHRLQWCKRSLSRSRHNESLSTAENEISRIRTSDSNSNFLPIDFVLARRRSKQNQLILIHLPHTLSNLILFLSLSAFSLFGFDFKCSTA